MALIPKVDTNLLFYFSCQDLQEIEPPHIQLLKIISSAVSPWSTAQNGFTWQVFLWSWEADVIDQSHTWGKPRHLFHSGPLWQTANSCLSIRLPWYSFIKVRMSRNGRKGDHRPPPWMRDVQVCHQVLLVSALPKTATHLSLLNAVLLLFWTKCTKQLSQ